LHILDTDIVTYHQQGREGVVQRINAIPLSERAITVITMWEQLRGRIAAVNASREGSPDLSLAYRLLESTVSYYHGLTVLPFDDAAAEKLAELRAQKVRGGTQDLRIAAIVLSVGGILVTANIRHFEAMPGLVLERWPLE
jgi:tRNA(fMet)-specific endonuclease VapC